MSVKNAHNKQVTGEEAKTENKGNTPTKVEKQFTYTKHNITINATSRAEADKKLAKKLSGDSDEE